MTCRTKISREYFKLITRKNKVRPLSFQCELTL